MISVKQSQLENALLGFIQEELGAIGYTDAAESFSKHGIESFQVLEIVLELERHVGKQLSVAGIPASGLESVRAVVVALGVG